MQTVVVLLLNLGGPDKLSNVQKFLFNLFNDKRIITLPSPFRWIIAKIISKSRAPIAQSIYSKIGGKSPLLDQTNIQAQALSEQLNKIEGYNFKVLSCMRHFYPTIKDLTNTIKNADPSEILLIPLYPQYSTTTTLSSFEECMSNLKGFSVSTLCCYYDNEDFVNGYVKLIEEAAIDYNKYVVLFSAHSLPEKIIKNGDPYKWQIEQSVRHIIEKLNVQLDYKITYQSKVGPVKWIGPNTEEVIRAFAKIGKNIVVVPVSFVSEHVETLVELDIEYKDIAKKYNVDYIRVRTLQDHTLFIDSLSKQIKRILDNKKLNAVNNQICCYGSTCPKEFSQCLMRQCKVI